MKDLKAFLWAQDLKKHKENSLTLYCDMDGVLADFESALVKYFNNFLNPGGNFSKVQDIYLKEGGIFGEEKVHFISLLNYVILEKRMSFITKADLHPRFKKIDVESYINHDYSEMENPLSFLTYRLIYTNYKFWKDIPWTPYGRFIWKNLAYKSIIPLKPLRNLRVLTTPMLKLGEGHGCFLGKQWWAYSKLLSPFDNEIFSNFDLIFEKNKEKYAHKNSLLIDDTLSNCERFKKAGGNVIHVDTDNFDEEGFTTSLESFCKKQV